MPPATTVWMAASSSMAAGAFQNVASRACGGSLDDVSQLFVHGHHQDASRRHHRFELLQDGQTIHVRQLQVQQDNVWLQRLDLVRVVQYLGAR